MSQIIVGATGGGLNAQTFTTDSGVATPAANNINILGGLGASTSGSGSTVTITVDDAGMDWVVSSGTTMVANTGYVADNGASVAEFTLPATASVGDTFVVVGRGSGGWKVAMNVGETMHLNSSSTTSGVGGYMQSTQRYNAIEAVCVTANTDFVVRNSSGNIVVA